MKTKPATSVVRWVASSEMPQIAAIEQMSYANPRTEVYLRAMLRETNRVCMVAERHYHGFKLPLIVGFMVYKLESASYLIQDIAVHPWHRRAGIGTDLLEYLIRKLSGGKRTSVEAVCTERNLDAQKFFRECGFTCTGILRNYFLQDDGYRFLFHG